MDTLWGLLSGKDNAEQEGPVFPQSTGSVWRLFYQTTSLCCPMFVVLDSAPKPCLTFLPVISTFLSHSLFLPRPPSLHKVVRESHRPLDKSVASMD
ncbi:hypothetical protein AMTRI_Chr03g149760 [Amborella trichopoda]